MTLKCSGKTPLYEQKWKLAHPTPEDANKIMAASDTHRANKCARFVLLYILMKLYSNPTGEVEWFTTSSPTFGEDMGLPQVTKPGSLGLTQRWGQSPRSPSASSLWHSFSFSASWENTRPGLGKSERQENLCLLLSPAHWRCGDYWHCFGVR